MKRLTIADLVQETDVPAATIHYYLRNELLPHPKHVAPNRFAYDERHVQGLRLIRMLRDRRGLSLPMIRRILPELLRLEGEEAFTPEFWDRALAPRMSRRRTPASRLLDSAKEAFTRRGYADANVDEICRSARVAKGSFYRHYRSKEDLFFAVAEALAEELVARFRADDDKTAVVPADLRPGLAGLLEPGLPVFLELFARALQRKPGYEACLRRVVEVAAAGIGTNLAGSGGAAERGTEAIGQAISDLLGAALGSGASGRPGRIGDRGGPTARLGVE
jgi:AcrR family transcriptional regulator